MKSIFLSLLFVFATMTQNAVAAGNASDFDQGAWDKKVLAYTQMAGRTFEYAVSGYRISLHFDNENQISWERLEAPDGTAGQKGTQAIDRQNVHPGIFIMAWTEPDGSHVVDIVDTQRMQLFANFVLPDGQRVQTSAQLQEVQ